MFLISLKEEAKELRIKGYTKMTEEELTKAIKQAKQDKDE